MIARLTGLCKLPRECLHAWSSVMCVFVLPCDDAVVRYPGCTPSLAQFNKNSQNFEGYVCSGKKLKK